MNKGMLAASVGLAAAAAGALLYSYRTCFHSQRSRNTDPYAPLVGEQYEAVRDNMIRVTGIMEKFPFEEVRICSHDGLLLYGRYYHNHDNAPLQILFHGYRSHPLRDCAGGFILARKLGFNILVIDQRAHGKSAGTCISFGVLERQDCLRWCHYCLYRFGKDTPIVLSGLSMGAATVLMAAELNLPKNVVCIMADCPYSSPAGIIRKVCRDRKMPDHLAAPFVHASAKALGRFDLDGCTAEKAVKHAKIPILLIHGEDDRFVPCQMSKDIYRSCKGNAQLHTFPGAGHGLSYMCDPVRYEKVVTDFLMSIPALKEHIKL